MDIIERNPNIITHNRGNASETIKFEHILVVGWMEKSNIHRCVANDVMKPFCHISLNWSHFCQCEEKVSGVAWKRLKTHDFIIFLLDILGQKIVIFTKGDQ